MYYKSLKQILIDLKTNKPESIHKKKVDKVKKEEYKLVHFLLSMVIV